LKYADAPNSLALLCAPAKRRRHHRTANKTDELPPSHP
jgi:hypothetical protein